MGVMQNKATGKWLYKFLFQGTRYRQKGFKTRDQAIQAEGRKRAEIRAPVSETPLTYFAEMATQYLDHCKSYMQKNTWRQKAFVFRAFIASTGNLPSEDISTTAIRKFLSARLESKGPKAANRSLRDLTAMFHWAIGEEIYQQTNPCKRIMKFAEAPYHPYIPPVEDVLAVKLAATPDERDFIEVLYHAIARKSEAIRLTWDDVNFERRWIRLWTRKRRGGELEPQYKPLNDTLHNVLTRRWKHRDKATQHVFSFTEKQTRNMMHEICTRAGVTPFGFHAIRHHVLSVINDSGKANVKQLQELAGHKRQSTTETYLHVIGSAVRDAAAILDEIEGAENPEKVSHLEKVAPEWPPRFSEKG